MGKENFIKGHGDNGHHDGRRSAVRRLQSAMDQMRYGQDRTIAHEAGEDVDVYPDIQPGVDPIVVYECKDIRLETHPAYNQSVTADWLQIDPAEDRPMNSPQPSRINPSS